MRNTSLIVALACSLSGLAFAAPDPIGPDCVNASFNDIARHGTSANGAIIGYSSGSITCNRGDAPMLASPNNSIRPLVGMNMYRYVDTGAYSRMEQLGQGWAKWVGVPVNGTSATCSPSCVGGGAGTMGVGCADVYSSGFNGPAGMGQRSRINPTLGTMTGARGGNSGDANITTRVQVAASEVTNPIPGTRYFFETVDFLPDDAQHIRAGQTVAVNAMNNATSQELSIPNSTSIPGMMATPVIGQPVISRWATLDSDVTITTADHDDTPNPNPAFPGTFIRSRFHVAGAATPLPGGLWRYEYAVFNLNSDRACGSLSIAIAPGATLTDTFFRHPLYHSGEPYSNAAWTWTRTGALLSIATEAFAANANANAIRWGTLYNFGFTTNAAPNTGSVALGLFKPGTLASINANGMPLPTGLSCPADVDGNSGVDVNDLVTYLVRFEAGSILADIDNDGDGTVGNADGGVDINDLLFYLVRFEGGC